MRDLTAVRDGTFDPFVRDAVETEMAALRARTDRLLDDMTIGDGRVHDRAIRADVSNLNRSMYVGAATERQGESQPQVSPSR